MADSVVVEAIKENLTEAAQNATGKIPASPEGMGLAYVSLLVMALVPIYFGSRRSIKHQEDAKDSGEKPETMTSKDAAMFPLIASCALFGLYIFFQVFSKEYINMLLTSYFFVLGILALAHTLSPVVNYLCPQQIPNTQYYLLFNKKETGAENSEELINYNFDTRDLIAIVISALVGVWYILKKHWISNNLLGLAFAMNGVELLALNNIVTGFILLGGLFVYDIFWVFGTDVMVTVAKSFDAPIKLIFPQDLLERGLLASNFAMLGLGDIVIPGIFIALLLRFDKSLGRGTKTYFNFTFLGYVMGMIATIVVMHTFKHPQPALLYLVPACIGFPMLLALIKGDISLLLKYEDHPEEKKEEEKKEN